MQTLLRDTFEGIANDPGFRVGMCARGLEGPFTEKSVGVGEKLVLPSASLIKVLILVELLRQVEAGRVSLEERMPVTGESLVEDSEMVGARKLPARLSLRRLAEGMITVSDNTATNLLIRRLGMQRVNALAHDLGMRRTLLRREMMDFEARARGEDNLTSASDMVVLLEEIWHGPSLSPTSRTLALDLLLAQELDSKIPITLPPGARYAHKTGELEGVENDAGLVLLPGRSFALAVLMEGDVERALPPVSSALSAIREVFSGTR